MDKLLFQNFLENSEEYEAAEHFWKDVFAETIRSAGQAGAWAPWRPRHYANGTPLERDGNPIFDARSVRLGRAVQVIQWPAEGGHVGISGWVTQLTVSDDTDNAENVLELTINLSLSEESAAIARALLSSWVDPQITREEMNQRIAQLAPSE